MTYMTKLLFAIALVFLFHLGSPAQVFKVPDNVFQLPPKDTGFDHGMLMIRQKFPGGAFIEYPKENETLDQLKLRLASYICPMFLHEKDETTKLVPQITSIPSHKGDLGSSAQLYLYATEKGQVQILFFERGIVDKSYVYGYFAYRIKDSKDNAKEWADDKGGGVKFFDGFWKTISP
jgi:hypothetical protein